MGYIFLYVTNLDLPEINGSHFHFPKSHQNVGGDGTRVWGRRPKPWRLENLFWKSPVLKDAVTPQDRLQASPAIFWDGDILKTLG